MPVTCAVKANHSAGQRAADAIWSYEAPYEAITEIKDLVAFYPDRVDVIEERTL